MCCRCESDGKICDRLDYYGKICDRLDFYAMAAGQVFKNNRVKMLQR